MADQASAFESRQSRSGENRPRSWLIAEDFKLGSARAAKLGLKIVEAMAMGKSIASTTLGVEGIEAVQGGDLFVEDQPTAFADAANRLLAEPGLAERIGQSARELSVRRYAWSAAARALESFCREILEGSSRQQRPEWRGSTAVA